VLRFLVIQHAACEPPGAYEDELNAREIAFERVQVDTGAPLPDWRAFSAIVAMGGPMGANDERELPWLVPEKALISEAVRAGKPYWGVCLGAQLLAASLGARVHRGERPEIGIYNDVELTVAAGADPVFAGVCAPISTLQWHGDTFELPDGATLLASSRAYPHQAFVWRRAYGIQFHLEVSSALAETWLDVPEYIEELTDELGAGGVERFAREALELDRTTPLARELFGRWIDGVVAPAHERRTATLRPA
jgi:GMP synthase (glutamine-hydrolysing)